MAHDILRAAFAAVFILGAASGAQAAGPTDPQIAHIAYSAGTIDIAAGKQALARSHDKGRSRIRVGNDPGPQGRQRQGTRAREFAEGNPGG